MHFVPIDRINWGTIEDLLVQKAAEGRHLEFKDRLPENQADKKKEFLADVTAFANAGGGDIVFGIRESREAGRNTGIADEIVGLQVDNRDRETLRLENLLRDGIEPRLVSCAIRWIEGPDGRLPVLVMRIPRSFAAPHMVKVGDSRFYSRNNAGKYPLDCGEIRSAFALAAGLPEKVRRFRDERLARIIAQQIPTPLGPGPKVVLHLLPISALDHAGQVDAASLRNRPDYHNLPLNTGGWGEIGRRPNLDGFLIADLGRPGRGPSGYLQFFRSGAVEAVDCALISEDASRPIPSEALERELILALHRYKAILEGLGAGPPMFVLLALLGVKDRQLALENGEHLKHRYARIDRDNLLLPDALAEDFRVPADSILKPVLDALWQAGGFDGDPHYRVEGKTGRWADGRGHQPIE